jgi:hypothetical protein
MVVRVFAKKQQGFRSERKTNVSCWMAFSDRDDICRSIFSELNDFKAGINEIRSYVYHSCGLFWMKI